MPAKKKSSDQKVTQEPQPLSELCDKYIEQKKLRNKDHCLATSLNDTDKAFYEEIVKPDIEKYRNTSSSRELFAKLVKRKDEKEISDDQFFRFLSEACEIIGTSFSILKIYRWQREMRGEDSRKAEKARNNLTKIGTTLAFKGWEKESIPSSAIKANRDKLYKIIKGEKLLKDSLDDYKKEILIKLVKAKMTDPRWVSVVEELNESEIPSSPGQIADLITAKYFNLTPGTVKQKCKEAEYIGKGRYKNKKPQ